MNLAFAKKAVSLNGGVFNRIGSMTNVLHAGGAHVSSNCTGWSLSRIGRSEQVTNGRHGVFAFHYESEYWTGTHKFHDLWKERSVSDVGVVFSEQFISKGNKLRGANLEAGLLKTADNLAGVMTFKTIWFE